MNISDRFFHEDDMIAEVRNFCEKNDRPQTSKALELAAEKHASQTRKPGITGEIIPYINHPLTLASHAIALGLDSEEILSACLLHDVCEDCGVAPEDLPVNEATRKAVKLLTKDEGFDNSVEAETAYYGAIAGDMTATIVKILDRCNNVSGMASAFSVKKIKKYIDETEDYVYPLLDKAEKLYPEYKNQFFLLRYHMDSVLLADKVRVMKAMKA